MSDMFNEKRGDNSSRVLPVLEDDGLSYNPKNPQNVRAAGVVIEKLSGLFASAVKAVESEGGKVPDSDELKDVMCSIALLASVSVLYGVSPRAISLFASMSEGIEELLESRDKHEAGGHCDECDPLKRSQFDGDASIGGMAYSDEEILDQLLDQYMALLKEALPHFIDQYTESLGRSDAATAQTLTVMLTMGDSEALSIDVGSGKRAVGLPVNMRSFSTVSAPERVSDLVKTLLDETATENPKNRGRISRVKATDAPPSGGVPISRSQIDAAAEQTRDILDRLRGSKKGGDE